MRVGIGECRFWGGRIEEGGGHKLVVCFWGGGVESVEWLVVEVCTTRVFEGEDEVDGYCFKIRVLLVLVGVLRR